MEISENDWMLYRKKICIWQENFMAKLCNEYVTILCNNNKKPSEKFWTLQRRLKEDQHFAGVIVEMKKNNILYDMVRLIKENAITIEDLSEFSLDIQNKVKYLLGHKP